MTWQVTLLGQTLTIDQEIELPVQSAGNAPAFTPVTLTNISGRKTFRKIGGTSGSSGARPWGWFVREGSKREVNGVQTALPISLEQGESVVFDVAVWGREDGLVLEPGVFTGKITLIYHDTGIGPSSEVTEGFFVSGVVRNPALPDPRVSKAEFFNRYFPQLPAGGQSKTNNPYGLWPTLLTKGYVDYANTEVQAVIDWAGDVRPTVFIDRFTGNSTLGVLPFDGVPMLLDGTDTQSATARSTFMAGIAALSEKPVNLAMYIGTMEGNSRFSALVSDPAAIFNLFMRSISPFMMLKNITHFICDEPHGLAAGDPRIALYETLRRLCQARGVQVMFEPRGPADRTYLLPADGWGLCVFLDGFDRTNPLWGSSSAGYTSINGWPPFDTQISDSQLTNQPVIKWNQTNDQYLLIEQAASVLVDGVGRSKPLIYSNWIKRIYRTLNLTSDQFVAAVNAKALEAKQELV